MDKREEEYSDVLSRLDDLGDPYNDMNIDEKKRHALVHFYERLKVFLFLKISFIEVPCALSQSGDNHFFYFIVSQRIQQNLISRVWILSWIALNTLIIIII